MATTPNSFSETLDTTGKILPLTGNGSASAPNALFFKVESGVVLIGADSANAVFPLEQADGILPIPHTTQAFFAKSKAGSAVIHVFEVR